MKITDDHFEYLKKQVEAVLVKYPSLVEEYEAGKFPRSEQTIDLQRRFCFDILHGAGVNAWLCNTLYKYMNDEHIYTALKAIYPRITKRY